jgi:hypothetical protein
MSRDQGSIDVSPVFRIDVAPTSASPTSSLVEGKTGAVIVELLQRVAAGQERQNHLLEELVRQSTASQRQRAHELNQWRSANPRLALACRRAAESLGRVQSEFLYQVTAEVQENEEHLADGDFVLQEFVDRFGPRMAHLNGILQVLSQLGAPLAPDSGSSEG